jgi:monoamine oxidase
VPAYWQSVFNAEELAAFRSFQGRMAGLDRRLQAGVLEPALLRLKDLSFAAWLEKEERLPLRVREFIRVTMEPEIGTEISRISALDGIDEWALFLGEGQRCYRIAGGNQRLVDALVERVGRVNLLLDRQVKGIRQMTTGFEITALDGRTLTQEIRHAHYVISTVPLYRLALDLEVSPPLSPQVREAIAGQSWGAYFTAHVFLAPAGAEAWIRQGTSLLPLLTDGPLGVIYDGGQAGAERVLSLLASGAHAERYNLQSPDATRQELATALEALWPKSAGLVRRWEFFRQHPRAIAAWPVGRSRFDALSQAVRRPQGRLYLAGDFTENSHSSGAVRSGLRAARALLAARQAAQSSASGRGMRYP